MKCQIQKKNIRSILETAHPGEHFGRAADSNQTTPRGIIAPGLDWIGCGYDASGLFARQESVKRPLFEFGPNSRQISIRDKQYILPNDLILEAYESEKFNSKSGITLRELNSKYSAKVKVSSSFLLFSGEITTNYEISTEQQWKYVYSEGSLMVWRMKLGISKELSQNSLKNLLTTEAKKLINSGDPSHLIEQYGTHYTRSFYLGGAIVFKSVTDSTKFKSIEELEIVAKASVMKFFNLTGEYTSNEVINNFDSTTTNDLEILGPTGFIDDIRNEKYSEWEKKIDDDPQLCDFDEGSLGSISKLADLPARQKILEEAIEKYLKSHQLERPLLTPPGMVIGLRHSLNQGLTFDTPNYVNSKQLRGGDLGASSGEGYVWNMLVGPDTNICQWDTMLPPGLVFALKHSINQKSQKINAFGEDAVTGSPTLPPISGKSIIQKVHGGDLGAPNHQGYCWYESTGHGFSDWSLAELLPRGTIIGLKHNSNQASKKLIWHGKIYDSANPKGPAPDGFVVRMGGDRGAPSGVGYCWFEKITEPKRK